MLPQRFTRLTLGTFSCAPAVDVLRSPAVVTMGVDLTAPVGAEAVAACALLFECWACRPGVSGSRTLPLLGELSTHGVVGSICMCINNTSTTTTVKLAGFGMPPALSLC